MIKMYSTMLMRKAKSWFTGYDPNIEGHELAKTRHFVCNGGIPKYVSRLREIADSDYKGMVRNAGSPLG